MVVIRSIARRPGRARVAALFTAVATVTAFAIGPPSASGDDHATRGARFRIVRQVAAREGRPFFDSREGAPAVQVSNAVASARAQLASSLGTQGVLDVSPITGTPRVVARLDGFLTGPSSAPAATIALGYVRSHLLAFGLSPADLAGLKLVRDYVDILGTHHLIWEQSFRGIPVFDSDLRAAVAKDGRLINVEGAPIPAPAPRITLPHVGASRAVAAARQDVGAPVTSPGRVLSVRGAQRATAFASGDDAELVLFARSGGATLAWKVFADVSSTERYLSIVDALTGRVLWRANTVKFDSAGTGSAWDYFPGDAVSNNGGLPQHPLMFPVAGDTALSGNNAHAFADVHDDNTPDPGDEIAASTPLTWNYPVTVDTTNTGQFCSTTYPCTWDPTVPFSWQQNLAQDATQVYYYVNHFHDHLLSSPIGFTEAAGNFQIVNASGQGKGGDPVLANVDDGADTSPRTPGLPDRNHVNNANMMTPPDGQPPTMQMYLFVPSLGGPSSNGGDEADIVYHEYTHGLSSRLITFADGTAAVSSAQAGAMGEAWSDWYALDFLANEGFVVDGPSPDVVVGQYVTGGVGIRFEPIDCPVGSADPACPGGYLTGPGGFTYGDFGKIAGGAEVHSDGEIWGQTLWDIRTAFGSSKAEMLITRGMELSPPEPSFLDARNAIIEADQVAFGGADISQLWQIFANRGMGFFASAIDGGDVHPVQDFSLPPTCPTDCGTLHGKITNSLSGDPLKGALVGLAGHMSGLAGDLAATTDANGHYSIPNVPFHDYELVLKRAGYEPQMIDVRVDASRKINARMNRDWASLEGGAKLAGFTRPDYTAFGCGPSGALDNSLSTGWGSDSVDNGTSGVSGPRAITVRLPKAVNVTSFGVASNGTCGDGPWAGVKDFTIKTKPRNGTWVTAVVNTKRFPVGQFVRFTPKAGATKVRMIRMIMQSNRGDPLFMDMLEVSVRGRPV